MPSGVTVCAPRFIAGLVLAVCLLAALPARAQIGSDRYSAIVMNAADGNVLIAANPDEPRHPASLTKMMTLYMVFEALRDRRLTLDQLVPVSPHAASMSPTKLGLTPGDADHRRAGDPRPGHQVGQRRGRGAGRTARRRRGSRSRQMMTLRARALGMAHTMFRNASGLPDPQQVTTARDLAVLARHLVQDFPDDYHYFSTPVVRVPRPDHPQPRPSAADLSGGRRHQDGLYRGVRVQPRHLGGARRRAADRRGDGRGPSRRARPAHGCAAGSGLRTAQRADLRPAIRAERRRVLA